MCPTSCGDVCGDVWQVAIVDFGVLLLQAHSGVLALVLLAAVSSRLPQGLPPS
jgi:hypothetical protein